MSKEGQGSPEGAPKSQSKPNQPEQQPQGGGIKSSERQSLLDHGEVQGELADLNVSNANTGGAESAEAGIMGTAPVKRRRKTLTFRCPPISDMDSED